MIRDAELNEAYRAALRARITFMIEDPRTISDCLASGEEVGRAIRGESSH